MDAAMDQKKGDLLKSFGIGARADAPSGEAIRGLLVRLLQAGDLGLVDLQTIRDIVELTETCGPGAHVFLATLFVARRRGHAYVTKESGRELLGTCGYVENPQGAQAAETLEAFRTRLLKVWDDDAQRDAEKLLKHPKGGEIVVKDGGRWFFQRDWKSVDSINKVIVRLVGKGAGDRQALDPQEIETFSSYWNPRSTEGTERTKAFELNKEQKLALQCAFQRQFTVITGGPGTGKTTTVCSILRAFLARNTDWTGNDIALAAPTARAAQRMRESIDLQCSQMLDEEAAQIKAKLENLKGTTVHRLLGGYAPEWRHKKQNPLEKKLVVVDEVSMVDVYLMRALLEALKDDCRLILLGDPDQLPSVDTGAVLGDLSKCGGKNGDGGAIVRLSVCERAQGDVSDIARRINALSESNDALKAAGELVEAWTREKVKDVEEIERNRTFPLGDAEWSRKEFMPDHKGSEFWWCKIADDQKDMAARLAFVEKWAPASRLVDLSRKFRKGGDRLDDDKALDGEMTSLAKELFAELNRVRVLSLVREGKLGVEGLNKLLFKKQHADMSVSRYLSVPGVPIMVTKNTPALDVFNGDIGVTVQGKAGVVVLFPRGERTVVCPVALLPEHELAYAMTVHKSQGSEFEQVLVVLPDDAKHPLLTREIVYTGITRAKKRAVVMGTEEALKAAISRHIVRNTGISLSAPA